MITARNDGTVYNKIYIHPIALFLQMALANLFDNKIVMVLI